MKVVVDTTVFGHGFNSGAADVRLLKGFLDRTPAELCVPAVVIEEAANLVRKSFDEVNHKLDATLRLTGNRQAYSKLDVEGGLAAYRASLNVLLGSLNARILPYPGVRHEDLVLRALAPTKPFVSSGRGYRDALIWFSVVELAQGCGCEISFISANSDDWCQGKKEFQLHSDFLRDLERNGIATSRVHFFSSLGDFIQQCAIDTLPVSSPAAEVTTHDPDYQRLLMDGRELVETLLADALPEVLRAESRSDASVEDLEVLGISGATDILPLPIRLIDSERRLLQFSAKYRVALHFVIRKQDLEVWSPMLSLHLRQKWDESRLRVQATTGIKVFFHMIERGEETEAFSLASISLTEY